MTEFWQGFTGGFSCAIVFAVACAVGGFIAAYRGQQRKHQAYIGGATKPLNSAMVQKHLDILQEIGAPPRIIELTKQQLASTQAAEAIERAKQPAGKVEP